MKDFDIEFTYTANGIMTVKAKNAEDASAKAESILKNGLPHNKDVFYTDSKGEVEFVNEAEETEHEG